MEPIEAYHKIREACLRRPELKYKDIKYFEKELDKKNYGENPLKGFCYVATLAFASLVKGAQVFAFKDKTHYFNVIDGLVWDLTAEQMPEVPPYFEWSYKVPGRTLTKRAKLLLEEVECLK